MTRVRPATEAPPASAPDTRFFESLGPLSLARLATLTGAELGSASDGERSIHRAATLGRADAGAVAFLADRRYLSELGQTQAAACFVSEAFAGSAPEGCAALVTPEPLAAYAHAAAALHRPRALAASGGAVDSTAELEAGVAIGFHAVIGPGARIGRGTQIGPNAVIGPGVSIGRDCRIGANAVIGFALIGDRVRILAGAVIGEAGFGIAGSRQGALDVPQLGRVIIQDGVTLGANSCVDRGAFEDTVIGENSKIDNLVQVGHNVRVGRNCVLAAQTGLAGSVTVGDGAMFGGRAGVADHLSIGAGARIAAAAGVMHDIPDGETWCGAPARPIKRFMREVAWVGKQAAVKPGRGAV